MRINEVESTPNLNSGQLEALTQFLIGRADDTGAQKQISVPAFLNLAQSMGMNLTKDSLIQLSQQPPLSNLIANIQDDQVIFKGSDVPDTEMSTDKARDVVDKMAQRAMKKGV
jgi:hypothetical protein